MGITVYFILSNGNLSRVHNCTSLSHNRAAMPLCQITRVQQANHFSKLVDFQQAMNLVFLEIRWNLSEGPKCILTAEHWRQWQSHSGTCAVCLQTNFWCTAYRNTYTLHAAGESGPPLLLSPKRTQVGLEWNFPPTHFESPYLLHWRLCIPMGQHLLRRLSGRYCNEVVLVMSKKINDSAVPVSTLAMNEKPPLRFAKNHPSEDAKSGRLPILGRGGFLKMEDPQHG